MGLAAAYHAAKIGHEVTLYEADSVAGGMAAHFDFDGLSIERFYHFICKSDMPTFELMEELGIDDKVMWVETKMGYYIEGRHYKWADPIALLTFPLMGFWQKIRYGLSVFRLTKQRNFDHLEKVNAKDWIVKECGQATYDLMWKRLLELKFYEFTDNISAAWIATRIKRIGSSRKSIFKEQLGYIDGGSQILIDVLVKKIIEMGGEIKLSTPVERVTTLDDRVSGIITTYGEQTFDCVISTVPTPLVSKMIPSLSKGAKAQYNAIKNIGVVCLLLKLKKAVTQNFWLNINDQKMEIPGIIEYSNLRPTGEHIIYVPYYMPVTNEKFKQSDEAFVKEAFNYIKILNSDIEDEDLIGSRVGRLKHSQPVCEPGFMDKIPDIATEFEGLYVADTCYYYPEDRGISESVGLAKKIVQMINT